MFLAKLEFWNESSGILELTISIWFFKSFLTSSTLEIVYWKLVFKKLSEVLNSKTSKLTEISTYYLNNTSNSSMVPINEFDVLFK